MLSFVRRGALSLALVSLLTSSVAAEVFEKLRVVPEGTGDFKAPIMQSNANIII